MSVNLPQSDWYNIDANEFRQLMYERVGPPGQYRFRDGAVEQIHFPTAGTNCFVIVSYSDRKIVGIKPGEAFDCEKWNQITEEIETTILVGSTKVGRDYSFSMYPVRGSWRGKHSAVQILPPHPDAPTSSVEMADHPFILEFPVQHCQVWHITNYRRQREHRNVTLLLNTLLSGRMNLLPRHCRGFWAHVNRDPQDSGYQWVKNTYSATLGDCVLDTPSTPARERIEELEPEQYFKQVIGYDGLGLRVPSDLDESICGYQRLNQARREEFNRAAFWLDMSSRQWDISISSSFAALVTIIESLINKKGPGSTKRFHKFLERYAPGDSLVSRRDQMYDLRSGILHGSKLMSIDEEIPIMLPPPWESERSLHEELWRLTRTALRNWLKEQR